MTAKLLPIVLAAEGFVHGQPTWRLANAAIEVTLSANGALAVLDRASGTKWDSIAPNPGASVSQVAVKAETSLESSTEVKGVNFAPGGDRPNLSGDPYSGFEKSVSKWFNTAAFALQPPYAFGNLGRNTMHAPGRTSLDLSVHREFNLREQLKLQFRAEAFSITNTPPFGLPGSALGNATFGVISDAGLPRNLQMALKLLF